MTYIQTNKDKRKVARVIVQAILLIIVLVVIIRALFVFSTYQPYDTNKISDSRKSGFIALSYFGVAREGTDTLISTEVLKQHLQALHEQGYVTITPQDIIDYYQNNKALPTKSLFLMFEDGRRDTAIFVQKILEEFNYCATILTYGNTITNNDSKFLNGKQLQELYDTSYFQIGSNGYRLSYINVFDRYQNYVGELESHQFVQINNYLQRDYNHYLMDYIRDENRVSKESYQEMEKRITTDYQKLKEVYQKEVKIEPVVHVLQHSNTGQFGTNKDASDINEKNIKEMFKINFNREGNCFNQEDTSIYDLTRVQPQPYWSTNHLLMKIQADTNTQLPFIVGNRQDEVLSLVEGAVYYTEESLTLTTKQKGQATVQITNNPIKDFTLSLQLQGNKAGIQGIYLLSDIEYQNAIYLELVNDKVLVKQIQDGSSQTIQEISLPKEVDKITYQTKGKNNIEGQIKTLETFLQTDITDTKKQEYQKKIEALSNQKQNDTDLYIPEIDVKEVQDRHVEITMKEDTLSMRIDDVEVMKDKKVKASKGNIFLQANWLDNTYSQRNINNQIYDGVFNKIVLTTNDKTLFTTKLSGIDKVSYQSTKYFEKIINWFIETL